MGGTSKRWTVLIEAALGAVSDVGAQKTLNSLLSSDAIERSVESDNSAAGALFSRISDAGVVTVGTVAAAQQVAYLEYRGQFPTQLEDGQRVLLATWAVQVIT